MVFRTIQDEVGPQPSVWASPASPTGWWRLGLFLVALLVFVVSFFPIDESDDDWWHLKAGKLLWEGKLGWYSADPFTETAKAKVWINHEWAAEWLFYAATELGGLTAANLLKSIILIITFITVYLSCFHKGNREPPTVRAATLAVCLAVPTSQFTMYLRPPIWSFLFLSLYHLLVITGAHRSGKDLPLPRLVTTGLVMASMMVLWANLHGGAILGCVVVFLLWVGSALEFLLGVDRRGIATWGIALLLVGGASLANPYGYHLHILTFEVMSERWLTERIFELARPRLDLVWTVPVLLIPAALGVVRCAGWGERLVFLFLLWQGLSHVRHLPLLAIWAAPYAARILSPPLALLSRKQIVTTALPGLVFCFLSFSPGVLAVFLEHEIVRILVVAGLASVSFLLLWKLSIRGTRLFLLGSTLAVAFVVGFAGQRPPRFLNCLMGQSWSPRNLPDKLADFILRHELRTDTLFTRETGAGYLIWRLSPEKMRVFSCTRFDLQGGMPVKEVESMLWLLPAWTDPASGTEVPSWETLWKGKYHFEVVLIEKYSDPLSGRVFKLWEYLNQPGSDFVRVGSEAWPGPGAIDRQWGLFVRRGAQLNRLMSEIKHPPWFEEREL